MLRVLWYLTLPFGLLGLSVRMALEARMRKSKEVQQVDERK